MKATYFALVALLL